MAQIVLAPLLYSCLNIVFSFVIIANFVVRRKRRTKVRSARGASKERRKWEEMKFSSREEYSSFGSDQKKNIF